MIPTRVLKFVLVVLVGFPCTIYAGTIVSTPFGTSYQVNVDSLGQNIGGDAANEPSLCIDPNNLNRIAVGWRQFDSTNSNFRQAGFGFSIDGGLTWTFGGTLQTNIFRSDPVLASDAEGRFYYLGLTNPPPYGALWVTDLWRSTNGGATWQLIGPATGGDKSWMTIDTTSGAGHGNIYQAWDQVSATGTNDFSLSYDGGLTWATPFAIPPNAPIFGTVDVGPEGEVYQLAFDGSQFWLNRSTNAPDRSVAFNFDLTVPVDLGGAMLSGWPNPGGLLGQAWVAVDRSTNQTRGNVYALCSTGGSSNLCDVMFARSTDGGVSWSAPVRLNTDPGTNTYHWFGTLAVAPNGRVDVCWYNTPVNPNYTLAQLYHTYSLDGGLSWASNRAVSAFFDPSVGYPQQDKIGDYMCMVALNDATYLAYSATFNGEEDVYCLRMPDRPIQLTIGQTDTNLVLSWNGVIGNTYCLQYKSNLSDPWPIGSNQVCLVASNAQMSVTDALLAGEGQRFYRVATAAYGASFPTIVGQPASLTNYASLGATFSVAAFSTELLSYQWKKDNVEIPGATRSSLTLRPLADGHQGQYVVTVTNINGAVDSFPAQLTVLPPPANAPDIPGLVLHLPFDDDLKDVTTRGNDGTAIHMSATSSNISSPTFVTGVLGSALHYSSDFGVYPCCTTNSADYVTLGVRPDLQFSSNVNFTVAYWIRLPTNYSGGDLPFFTDAINSTFGAGFVFAPTYGTQGTISQGGWNGGWAVSLFDGATGLNGLGIYGDPSSINDGAWHHLVHSFDRTNGVVTYLDGVAAHFAVESGASIAAAGNVETGHPATIGQDPTGQYKETGAADIDDLGVWRRALTALEAASIYMAAVSNHLSFTGAPPVLVGFR